MLLVITLPIGALMVAVLQTRYSDVNAAMTIEQQIAIKNQKMQEANRKMLYDWHEEAITEIALNRNNQDLDTQELDRLLALGLETIQLIDDGQSSQFVLDYFVEHLSQAQQEDFYSALGILFGNNDVKQSNTRGWTRTHLVVAWSLGYVVGTIAGWMFSVALSGVMAALLGSLGPFGLFVGAMIGNIFGSILSTLLDEIVYRTFGIMTAQRHVIWTIYTPWFWDSDTDWNLFDILQLALSFMGGKYFSGKRPAGVAAPSYA
jgi:hypothetical protein